jgi:hypothetical protein
MRQTAIIVSTALITAIVAILGAAVIRANPPMKATAAPASVSIDVMQMMREAKNLPHQQFDAQ